MQSYLSVLNDVYHNGRVILRRAGERLVQTQSLFQRHLQFDLAIGFPILTTKPIDFDAILTQFIETYVDDCDVIFGFVPSLIERPEESIHTLDRIASSDAPSVFQVYPVRLLLHERMSMHYKKTFLQEEFISAPDEKIRALIERLDLAKVPRYRLDAAAYFAGQDLYNTTPTSIVTSALLLTYLSHKAGYAPGIYTHLMGDVEIDRSDMPAIREQLNREPQILPSLLVDTWDTNGVTLVGYEPYHNPSKQGSSL